MKSAILISGLIAVLFVSSCTRNDKTNSTQQSVTSDALQKIPLATNESEDEVAGNLVLNNANKWQANPETIEGIRKMQNLVDDYLANTNTNKVKVLGENLEAEISDILEKCTMTGDAHAQLHNYLLPLREKIERLKDNHDIANVKVVKTYLTEFDKYFH